MLVVVLEFLDTHCKYIANIPEYIPRPGNNWTSLAGYKLKYIEKKKSYHIRTLQDT